MIRLELMIRLGTHDQTGVSGTHDQTGVRGTHDQTGTHLIRLVLMIRLNSHEQTGNSWSDIKPMIILINLMIRLGTLMIRQGTLMIRWKSHDQTGNSHDQTGNSWSDCELSWSDWELMIRLQTLNICEQLWTFGCFNDHMVQPLDILFQDTRVLLILRTLIRAPWPYAHECSTISCSFHQISFS